MKDRILTALSFISMICAAIFYFLFKRYEIKANMANIDQQINNAKKEAMKQAEIKHEEVTKNGAIAVAADIADMVEKR